MRAIILLIVIWAGAIFGVASVVALFSGDIGGAAVHFITTSICAFIGRGLIGGIQHG